MHDDLDIREDDLRSTQVIALLREHVDEMRRISPPGSSHALDLEGLRRPEVAFWCAWREGELAGCAALKALGNGHGEIKSMRTARAHLRRGVAAALLCHVLDEARRRGYGRLSLGTGSMIAFEPARRLYARFGFAQCAPFGGYVEDPHSTFMTLALDTSAGASRAAA